jgi:hypothetical protein
VIHSSIPDGRDGAVTIGLVADTHCHAGQISLPDAVLDALSGADLILHLGDMGEATVLDRLASVAPVLATRGGDDPAADPRVADDPRLLSAAGVSLAAAFELGQLIPGAKSEGNALPAEPIGSLLRTRAGRDTHAVLFAATHSPALFVRDGVLFLNPGSATLPNQRGPSGLGTIARLVIRGATLEPQIVQL